MADEAPRSLNSSGVREISRAADGDVALGEVDRRARASAYDSAPRRRRLRTAKERLRPGQKLLAAERLRDVVVGARLQAADLLELARRAR